jgi:cellulose synthase/poly-beta-1,6-N-acetylglucosamine synthase-like glycosyltransferase
MWLNILNSLYIILLAVISLFGLNALIITILYLVRFLQKKPCPLPPENWPQVVVQIPLYNEEFVAERIIDQICAFNYPREKLQIQVLDDSTDKTTEIARQRVAYHRNLGSNIILIHRSNRKGYKAGALEGGLAKTQAEFIAVFDADFLPPKDYLRKVIPYLTSNPSLGMVQARWGHINRESNLITRTQALFLDGHQIVEQVARSRSGLICNFNGSGGVWRAQCIRESGGWQMDTLSEDIDLSFRAQMAGWKLTFLPDLVVPGEIPPGISIFKQQQYRWNFGYAQVMKKLMVRLWKTKNLTFAQRFFGSFQLAATLNHLAGLFIFVLCVPLAFLHPRQPSSLGLISIATSGPSILFAAAQIFGYHDSPFRKLYRLIHLPLLVFITIGTSINNSQAVLSALSGKQAEFIRTPKYNLNAKGKKTDQKKNGDSANSQVWIEFLFCIYMAIGLCIALQRAPELIPLAALGMISFGFVGIAELAESRSGQGQGEVKAEKTGQVELPGQ